MNGLQFDIVDYYNPGNAIAECLEDNQVREDKRPMEKWRKEPYADNV